MNLLVHDLVYVHCHQGMDSDSIVLVGRDGTNFFLSFPRGGHLLTFLCCLENGLQPQGILDPPFQGFDNSVPKRSVLSHQGKIDRAEMEDEQRGSDFVFRIIYVASSWLASDQSKYYFG